MQIDVNIGELYWQADAECEPPDPRHAHLRDAPQHPQRLRLHHRRFVREKSGLSILWEDLHHNCRHLGCLLSLYCVDKIGESYINL